MILVADRTTRQLHYFPAGRDHCAAADCPVGHELSGLSRRARCVLGVEGGEVHCLGTLPDPVALLGCGCPQPGCPHLWPGHPALLAVLERLAGVVEPADARRTRHQLEVRTALLAGAGDQPAPLPPSRKALELLTTYAPHALEGVPLTTKEPA